MKTIRNVKLGLFLVHFVYIYILSFISLNCFFHFSSRQVRGKTALHALGRTAFARPGAGVRSDVRY